MLILGLTGSMAMGKSTAAARFRERGIPVFDADAYVHDLYTGAAVAPISQAFPHVVEDGKVDRHRLSAHLQAHPEDFKRLEAIVHPLVRQAERNFILQARDAGKSLVVLEVPLLFETGMAELVDVTVVVSAPQAVQEARILARPGMTREKLQALLSRQMPDSEKRHLADYVVDTSGPISQTHARIDSIITELEGREGQALARWEAMEDPAAKAQGS